MGSSPDATLVYGIDIGDGEDGYGTLAPLAAASIEDVDWIRAWIDRFDDEDRDEEVDDPDFSDAMIRTLAERSGWTDTDTGLLASEHVRQHLGIVTISYGDSGWESVPLILTTADTSLRIGTAYGTMNAGPVAVHPIDLAPEGLHQGAAQISHALALLGVTTTRQPCWLLVADYG